MLNDFLHICKVDKFKIYSEIKLRWKHATIKGHLLGHPGYSAISVFRIQAANHLPYCTISTECSWGVMHDLWCSHYQVFIVVCDAWRLWKCSWKRKVFTDFLICTISSLIEECDECACLRPMSCSSDWHWVGERNMPLGAAKNFLIDDKATFSNSQKMSLLNSWLAQGKSWADIPPAIKWHAKTEFKIPSALYGKLLPEPTTSLATMSNYTLPVQITSGQRGPTAELASFFSKDQPCSITSSTILCLHQLHIPETSIIWKLVEYSHQAWLDGHKSIRYSHLHDSVVTNFPLWIITYWNGILDVQDHVKRWAACKDWVVVQTWQIKFTTRRNLAEEAVLLLNDLPWDAKKPSGLSDGEHTNTLWRFLQTNWLSDSEMNDMLELLCVKVLSNHKWSGKFHVKGVHLTEMILKAFKTAGTDAYMSRREFAWARSVGKELEAWKMVLLTAGHLGQLEDEPELHWVSIMVDTEQGVTHYGDSFKTPIPEEIHAVYEWWMNQHRPKRLTSNHLPISHQLDGHACGFFAINALKHHVHPEGCPLLNNNDVASECLSKFNAVAKHISVRVCTSLLQNLTVLKESRSSLLKVMGSQSLICQMKNLQHHQNMHPLHPHCSNHLQQILHSPSCWHHTLSSRISSDLKIMLVQQPQCQVRQRNKCEPVLSNQSLTLFAFQSRPPPMLLHQPWYWAQQRSECKLIPNDQWFSLFT